ncbi:type VI secretion system baseplate subunit TssG [Zooshikella marina]|uniref:type VI secretion system baseplate subunit TssG n=1 Tax=Zooshikella ganghwensis TaxID=202772 RepID=UPI0012F82F93|nr:type VI secretion system baseplate subunit TssG [Zooshikella ganghwensis]MBU2708001.1 type VI secretion system baseplate subunit TssG [Zooshikella ganghwensis]
MGASHRSAASALMYDLLVNSRQYSFYQAVHLLTSYYIPVSGKFDDQPINMRYRANATLAFPPSDIASLEIRQLEARQDYLLTVNFMGLYGPASPLPAFYTERIVQNDPENHPIRDFMDLFNHRYIELLYHGWKKYRYYLNYQEEALDDFSKHMFSLIGLGEINLRKSTHLHWHRLLPYLGLLSMRIHSAGVLSGIMRHYFQHKAISIQQCMLRVVPIPEEQRNRLGAANCEMGINLVLGASVRDRSGKFRVVIDDLDFARFERFLPSGDDYRPLHELIKFIQRDQLEYDIKLGLRPYEAPKLELKQSSRCRLGWTTWLGEHQSLKNHHEVVLPSYHWFSADQQQQDIVTHEA